MKFVFQNLKNIFNMQKIVVFLFFIIFSVEHSFAQTRIIADKLLDSDSLVLIGMYPIYDTNKTYEKYNFIIKDIDIIKKIATKLQYGAKKHDGGIVVREDFSINLMKNHKTVRSWCIIPKMSLINIDGNMYHFDIKILEELSKQYPFTYKSHKINFQTREAFEQYKKEAYQHENFLFMYEPSFTFEGRFDVEYPKNKKFPHPKGISKYLDKYIKKLNNKYKYGVTYAPMSKYNNGNWEKLFSMTIECDKALYEQFEDPNGKKREWIPEPIEAVFFLQKK